MHLVRCFGEWPSSRGSSKLKLAGSKNAPGSACSASRFSTPSLTASSTLREPHPEALPEFQQHTGHIHLKRHCHRTSVASERIKPTIRISLPGGLTRRSARKSLRSYEIRTEALVGSSPRCPTERWASSQTYEQNRTERVSVPARRITVLEHRHTRHAR